MNFSDSNKNLAEALNKKPLQLDDDDLPPSTAIEEVKKVVKKKSPSPKARIPASGSGFFPSSGNSAKK